MDVGRILEITFVAIVLYLILKYGDDFASGIKAIGGVYVDGVKALQGR